MQRRACTASRTHKSPPRGSRTTFMQSGLVESQPRALPSDTARPAQPTATQHGPGRSRPSLPPDVRCRSPDAQPGPLDDAGQPAPPGQTPGRLNGLGAADAGSRPAAVPGKRISDYENAVVCSSPRRSPRPAPAFRVTNGSRSGGGGVQLTDFPNGSSVP